MHALVAHFLFFCFETLRGSRFFSLKFGSTNLIELRVNLIYRDIVVRFDSELDMGC